MSETPNVKPTQPVRLGSRRAITEGNDAARILQLPSRRDRYSGCWTGEALESGGRLHWTTSFPNQVLLKSACHCRTHFQWTAAAWFVRLDKAENVVPARTGL